MTIDRGRLLADEAAGWQRLADVVATIPPERMDEPSVTPDDWSPADTLFHVAAWLDLCADVCERIADGTWDPATADEETSGFVDRVNAEQVARARAMTPQEVEARLARARGRARAAFEVLPEVTPDAWSWFEESGPMHYAKHVHDLAAFAAGIPSDPQVGPLLQRETDAWLELIAALDAVPGDAFTTAAPDGWSPRETVHHLACWLEMSAGAVADDRYWYDGEMPAPEAVIDGLNARFLDEAKTADIAALRPALERARTRMREALSGLVAPSAAAKRTFELNTTEHYAEHVATFRGAVGDRP